MLNLSLPIDISVVCDIKLFVRIHIYMYTVKNIFSVMSGNGCCNDLLFILVSIHNQPLKSTRMVTKNIYLSFGAI